MLSVNSARQLCKMFLSLHVVFLSVAMVESSASNGKEKDCIRSNGVEYRGEQGSSSSGLTCLNWTNTSRDYDFNMQLDSQTEQASTTPAEAKSLNPTGTTPSTESFQPAKSGGSQGEVAAVQPVMGISQRVRTGPKQKKDLGTLGYVLGILMMAIIIILGAGITLGYFYKRGRDLKKQHDQRVYEREMQRITLPLSAFSNPTCELVDENTIVITAEHETTPVQEGVEGGDPLMGQQAGTPGA
ncbi:phosphoinositide-3-kinase-interacting protein 1 [Lates japonicus]|uniref:Phosphoinositide-3-kinase-interacting protein 1 n=1 Tax=Lates japonicus TaxID=270547 RepID=A0AAD3QZD3_LATJO|nr:phosphoinositide-3-kinase-interacting protein 1 [Lates japonicus]